jgi:hypothetical protein
MKTGEDASRSLKHGGSSVATNKKRQRKTLPAAAQLETTEWVGARLTGLIKELLSQAGHHKNKSRLPHDCRRRLGLNLRVPRYLQESLTIFRL